MARNRGYVSIWRDIQDNDLWNAEPFSKGQAWIDLILSANHEEKTFLLGNETVNAEVGSVITSELKLMNRWKWGKEKLRNYLKLLEKLGMIKRIPDHKKTVIIICNYAEYQKNQTITQTDLNAECKGLSGNLQTDIQTDNRPSTDCEQTMNHTQTITKNNYTITKNKKRESCVCHKYGEYGNVLLSEDELKKLQVDYPSLWRNKLEALSGYMKSTGKSYKDHYVTLRNWIKKDLKEGGESCGVDSTEDKGKVFNPEEFL